MRVRFQTKRYIACKHINLHGLLSLRGENFRWADLVSGNLKEVEATSPPTLGLRNAAVKPLYSSCRCSKIMSPPNCNETLSPYEGQDDKINISEDAATPRLAPRKRTRAWGPGQRVTDSRDDNLFNWLRHQ